MSLPLIFLCIWIIAAAGTAMLPRGMQMVPGFALLVAVPPLLASLGMAHGWWWSALGFAAFASMFRNAFLYFWARARGAPAQTLADARSAVGDLQ